MYESLETAAADAAKAGVSLGELALAAEASEGQRTRAELEAELRRALAVMRAAVARGLAGEARSMSGLVGGDAAKLGAGRGPLAGTLFARVVASALAVQEVNAAMGLIVAAPTAGAAGTLPAVILEVAEYAHAGDEAIVRGLATAGLVGAVAAARASISGAEGGCQAETGVAAAMAAAAGAEILGASPEVCLHAVSLTLQGLLGLVCDPVAGLVEIPCVHRNATASAVALAGLEMALAGIRFPIPADEVIDAMGEIGKSLPSRYRETAGGGLATTPTGRKLTREKLVKISRLGGDPRPIESTANLQPPPEDGGDTNTL